MKRNIIKEVVLDLDSYKPEPQEAKIILNANENPYNLPSDLREELSKQLKELDYNRYPDPMATELRKTFSQIVDIPEEQIIAGSGLDEILSIITNTFIEPGDVVVTHKPGFAMYKIWSEIAGAEVIEVEDTEDQKIDIEGIVNEAIRNNAKIIYICSPSNPTGQAINLRNLEELLEAAPALVVLDEAYVDFSDESFIDIIKNYDNLMVLRTMSKAYRIPSTRCGFAVGPVDLIEAMYKVKSPYNLNSLTQKVAQVVLENKDELEPAIEEIKNQRDEIYERFKDNPNLVIYPSQSNFLYFKTPKHKELQKEFLDNDILIRYYPDDQAFRLTIGKPKENKEVIKIIEEVINA